MVQEMRMIIDTSDVSSLLVKCERCCKEVPIPIDAELVRIKEVN